MKLWVTLLCERSTAESRLKYLLDSNTYIEANNLYYGMEVCSGYWQWLDTQFQNNLVNSVQPIFDVLNSYGDELSAWVKERENQFLAVTLEN